MFKNKIFFIGLTVLYLGLSVVFLSVYLNLESKDNHFSKDTIMVGNQQVTKQLSVSNLALSPGSTYSYPLSLTTLETNTYLVTLIFNEVIDGGLKNFIDIEVIVSEVVLSKTPFKELLDDKYQIQFEIDLSVESTEGFTIKYIMPSDVGNEAMKTYANFNININIKSSGS